MLLQRSTAPIPSQSFLALPIRVCPLAPQSFLQRRIHFSCLHQLLRKSSLQSNSWEEVEILPEDNEWEPIDYLSEEELEEELDLFEYESGPVSNIQEVVALGLGALILAAFINICWRLIVVVVSVGVTAFKYSFLAVLLVFLSIFLL